MPQTETVTNRAEVIFAMYGETLDPAVITRELEIEPSRIRTKSDPRPRLSCWAISTGEVEGELVDLYELASSLIARLRPRQEAIARVCQQYGLEAELEFVVHISQDDAVSTPAIGLAPADIAFLSAVGASLDVDTYRSAA